MSEHKIKREMRILGWTKASHKSAVRYFSNEREDRPFRSLKKKKKCRFNKGVHVYERHEKDFFKRIYCEDICKNCGKQRWSIKNGDSGVTVA